MGYSLVHHAYPVELAASLRTSANLLLSSKLSHVSFEWPPLKAVRRTRKRKARPDMVMKSLPESTSHGSWEEESIYANLHYPIPLAVGDGPRSGKLHWLGQRRWRLLQLSSWMWDKKEQLMVLKCFEAPYFHWFSLIFPCKDAQMIKFVILRGVQWCPLRITCDRFPGGEISSVEEVSHSWNHKRISTLSISKMLRCSWMLGF